MTRRFIRLALVAVTLSLSLGVITQAGGMESPSRANEVASAPTHTTNTTWAFYCASKAPPDKGATVEHAHPYLMDEFHVRFYCNGDTESGLQECTWHVIAWVNGPVTGPYGAQPYCTLNSDGLQGVQMLRGSPAVVLHNFDATSFWSCGATRPAANYIVRHSHPVLFTSQRIDYACTADRTDHVVCYRWIATVWLTLPGTPITGHDYHDTVPSNCT